MMLMMAAAMTTMTAAVTTRTVRVTTTQMMATIAIAMAATVVMVRVGAVAVTVKERVAAGRRAEVAVKIVVVQDTTRAGSMMEGGMVRVAAAREIGAVGRTR